MSNNVQAHEDVAAGVAGDDRRGSARHAAGSLGSVNARIIGGSQVDLVNFSSRGVLFECDSRLLIGARASVRITTTDANLVVTGRVVRSRVKGLVNGALRYDAALVLDHELALTPAILASVPAVSDDLVSFESDLDDPSPVEAYVAESEASLLDIASGADLSLHPGYDVVAVDSPADAFEAEREPIAFEAEAEAESEPIAFEAVAEVEAEPEAEPEAEMVAFEAEDEIAFEPSVEFAFDDSADVHELLEAEPAASGVGPMEHAAVDEPAASSMFDATYIPPVYELDAAASQFEVTPPHLAAAHPESSFFDARPSAAYGEAAEAALDTMPMAVGHVDVAVVVELTPIGATTPASDELAGPDVAADSLDAESDIAFEAEDAVTFETAFEEPISGGPMEAQAADVTAAADDDIDAPASVADTDDRVLLQFAATVPHDLAELRRIAADNQW